MRARDARRPAARRASTAATWIALGKVSLEDWLALTTSFGWHSTPARAVSDEITSLTFMLVLVPEPVWKTSIGNWSSCSPVDDLGGGGHDRVALLGGDHVEVGVGACGGGLDPGERVDRARRQRPAADREVVDRALGLGPPQGVGGHLDARPWSRARCGSDRPEAHASDATAADGLPSRRGVEPVVLVAVLEADVVAALLGVAEDRAQRSSASAGARAGGPDDAARLRR